MRVSQFVRMADTAVCIGGPEPRDSYLRGERILEAAGMIEVEMSEDDVAHVARIVARRCTWRTAVNPIRRTPSS